MSLSDTALTRAAHVVEEERSVISPALHPEACCLKVPCSLLWPPRTLTLPHVMRTLTSWLCAFLLLPLLSLRTDADTLSFTTASGGLCPNSTRVAVLLHGETFRARSHQGSRETGLAGVPGQRDAAQSHLSFLFHTLVFDLNFTGVEVYIETYATGYEGLLLRWYGGHLKKLDAVHTQHHCAPVLRQ